ncbi:MAG: DUF2971 domain-containing protein [Phycisphaerales bacterium]
MQQPEYLYHYTTLDAFISIVDGQELWASNVFYLNDSAEFRLAIALAGELLKADIGSEANAERREELENVAKLLADVTPGVMTAPSCFVCSFSKEEDDLNQWRAYCRNGGVAIGFRRGDLESLVEKQGLGFAPLLIPCIYEERRQREEIRAAVSKAVRSLSGGRIGASMSPDEIDKFRAGLLQYVLVDQPIKSDDFAAEKEWRLIARPDPGMGADERLGFRSRNGLVIPFWRINLNPSTDRQIWEHVRVVVGPSAHPREAKAAIEALLVRYCGRHPYRVSNQVENSRVTYRYW